MSEAADLFYIEEFESRLDADPYLIAFDNGVYDLKKHIFRSGRPEDYISKKMPIEYDDEMTEKDESIMMVEDFLEKIFPDKSVRQYFVDVTSEIFVGNISEMIIMNEDVSGSYTSHFNEVNSYYETYQVKSSINVKEQENIFI